MCTNKLAFLCLPREKMVLHVKCVTRRHNNVQGSINDDRTVILIRIKSRFIKIELFSQTLTAIK